MEKDDLHNYKFLPMVFDVSPMTSESFKSTRMNLQERNLQKNIRPKRHVPSPPPVIEIKSLLQDIYTHRSDAFSLTAESSSRMSLIDSGSVIWNTSYEELRNLSIDRLRSVMVDVKRRVIKSGHEFERNLFKRHRLRRKQSHLCTIISFVLTSSLDEGVAVGGPSSGSGFDQWLHAMRLVARLPQGIPPDFRKKLWLALADKHLQAIGIDWPKASRICFSETSSPDDGELGTQIVKDLHRTGCSLFCGEDGQENQAMLKRVLLAYARWNKKVGYCQGFNMIAALILEVMDRNEPDSLKVMIYLVEAVLPNEYFSDSLRGLAVDLAALRDLLRLRRPQLAAHLQKLQMAAPDGGVNEPPLTDVFAMQWFLTLYVTWLPRETALRVWDLVLLDGNELLLITALAIWDALQDRILSTRSADEFYTLMGGVGAGGADGADGDGALAPDALAQGIAQLGPAPELRGLRERHKRDQAAAATSKVQQKSRGAKGHRLFYSEDESSDEADKLAITPAFGQIRGAIFMSNGSERLSLDIGALKRQYARLRERQRQAHVILAAACARQTHVPTSPVPLSMNHLLLGKNAIVSSRGRRLGPPPGAIPPSRSKTSTKSHKRNGAVRCHKDSETINWQDENNIKSSSRRDSIKWKDLKNVQENRSLSLDDTGDGQLISEIEANAIISSMKNRRHSESSSYSESSDSSTSTSLCDEPNKMSDFDSESQSVSENIIQLPEDIVQPVIDSPVKQSIENPDNIFFDYVQEFGQLLDRSKVKDLFPDLPGNKDITIKSPNHIEACSLPNDDCKEAFENKSMQFPKNIDVPQKDSKSDFDFSSLYKSVDEPPGEIQKDWLFENTSNLNCLQTSSPQDETYLSNTFKNSEYSKTNEPYLELRRHYIAEYDLSLQRDNKKDIFFPNEKSISPTRDPALFSKGFIKSSLYRRDVIDDLTIYPNFVPEIELTNKSFTDLDSPGKSDCGTDILVSEDEPPIQLKIDKYFEHSPEFFGARRYQSSNEEEAYPIRSPLRYRPSRKPKKPDSLLLHTNLNDAIDETSDRFHVIQNEIEVKSSEKTYETSFFLDKSPLEVIEHDTNILQLIHDDFENEIKSYENCPQNSHSMVAQSNENNPKLYDAYDNEDSSKRLLGIGKTKSEELPPKSSLDLDLGTIDVYAGRRNSEKALKIIQENSKILSRILTKQVSKMMSDVLPESSNENSVDSHSSRNNFILSRPFKFIADKTVYNQSTDFNVQNDVQFNFKNIDVTSSAYQFDQSEFSIPINKENSQDNIPKPNENIEFYSSAENEEYLDRDISTMRTFELDKIEKFGFENKAFLANDQLEYPKPLYTNISFEQTDETIVSSLEQSTRPIEELPSLYTEESNKWISDISFDQGSETNDVVRSILQDKRVSSEESPDASIVNVAGNYVLHTPINLWYQTRLEDKIQIDENKSMLGNKLFTSKSNELSASIVDDTMYKSEEGRSHSSELIPKIQNIGPLSELTHIITSSISLSYEPSTEDVGSSTLGHCNSNDTLCQITSLDQVSTPISPKIFSSSLDPRDIADQVSPNATYLKEFSADFKYKVSSDETSNAVTSLLESETASSFSLKTPSSPSSSHKAKVVTRSPDKIYNPFPRSTYRQPRDLGVRLGMYTRDPLKSPSK